MTYSSEHDGYKIIQRPVAKALFAGFKKGGRQALLFSLPIIRLALYKNDPPGRDTGVPITTALVGGVLGSMFGGISSLLPMKKEDISKIVVRENFIKRAATVGARTGTFIGAAPLIMCLRYHLNTNDLHDTFPAIDVSHTSIPQKSSMDISQTSSMTRVTIKLQPPEYVGTTEEFCALLQRRFESEESAMIRKQRKREKAIRDQFAAINFIE